MDCWLKITWSSKAQSCRERATTVFFSSANAFVCNVRILAIQYLYLLSNKIQIVVFKFLLTTKLLLTLHTVFWERECVTELRLLIYTKSYLLFPVVWSYVNASFSNASVQLLACLFEKILPLVIILFDPYYLSCGLKNAGVSQGPPLCLANQIKILISQCSDRDLIWPRSF